MQQWTPSRHFSHGLIDELLSYLSSLCVYFYFRILAFKQILSYYPSKQYSGHPHENVGGCIDFRFARHSSPDLMSYHRIGILISVQNLVIRSLQMPISVTTRDRRQRTLYFISIFSRPGKASTS